MGACSQCNKESHAMQNFDIAVIGGGAIGLSLARKLAGEKLRVAVIDAGEEIPPATNAAAGMLAPSFEDSVGDSDALYRLSADSLGLWPAFAAELEDETGVSVDFRNDGILGVALTEAQTKSLAYNCEALKTRGAVVEMLTGDEVRQMEPALSDSIIAGLYAEKDAQVDTRKLLKALQTGFVKRGGVLIDGRAQKASKLGGGFQLVLANGERIEAGKLVLAFGAAPTPLIDGLPQPPVTPVKGEALAVETPAGILKRVVRGPGAYLCPKAEGRFVIGATEFHERSDLEVDDLGVRALKVNACAILPAAIDFRETERWAGLRPGTPDAAPILGRDGRGPNNVYLALGHYRNGILLAPASADALAAEIVGKTPLTDLKPFSPERFG